MNIDIEYFIPKIKIFKNFIYDVILRNNGKKLNLIMIIVNPWCSSMSFIINSLNDLQKKLLKINKCIN